MPNWIANELTVAGPRGPVETLDAELWEADRAAKDGNGMRLDVAVPAVPADTKWNPGYPGGDFGEHAWGCRAVSHARRHRRTVTESTTAWLAAHPNRFYFGIDDFAFERTGDPGPMHATAAETARYIDEAARGPEAPAAISYGFDTAWRPPAIFVEKLAQRYPHLYLRLMWQGEEAHVHGLVVHGPEQNWPVDAEAVLPPEAVLDAVLAEKARRHPPPYAAARRRRIAAERISA